MVVVRRGGSLWSPMMVQSYEAMLWPSAVWVASWSCMGSKFIDLAGSAWGARSLIRLLHRGGCPRICGIFMDCRWSTM
jgi:hypothetical protein